MSKARSAPEFVYRGGNGIAPLVLEGTTVHGHDPMIGEYVIYRYPAQIADGGKAEIVGSKVHRLLRYEVQDLAGVAAILWCRTGEVPDQVQLERLSGELGASLPVMLVGPTQ